MNNQYAYFGIVKMPLRLIHLTGNSPVLEEQLELDEVPLIIEYNDSKLTLVSCIDKFLALKKEKIT